MISTCIYIYVFVYTWRPIPRWQVAAPIHTLPVYIALLGLPRGLRGVWWRGKQRWSWQTGQGEGLLLEVGMGTLELSEDILCFIEI